MHILLTLLFFISGSEPRKISFLDNFCMYVQSEICLLISHPVLASSFIHEFDDFPPFSIFLQHFVKLILSIVKLCYDC